MQRRRRGHLAQWSVIAVVATLLASGCTTVVGGTPIRAAGDPTGPTTGAGTGTGPTGPGGTTGTISGQLSAADGGNDVTLAGLPVSVYNSVTGALAGGPTPSAGSGTYQFDVPGDATYLVCADAAGSAGLVSACSEASQVLAGQTATVGVTLPRVAPVGQCDPGTFTDVAHSAYCPDITWMVGAGIANGVDKTHFDPGGSIRRGQLAVLLYRLAHQGSDAPACTAAPFPDVPADASTCGAISWLVEADITAGTAQGGFQPAAEVTRAQVAVFLYRMATQPGTSPSCSAAPFADVPADAPTCGAISWMVQQGAVTGGSGATFDPGQPATRGELASWMHRLSSTQRITGEVTDSAHTGISGVSVVATGIAGTKTSYSTRSWQGGYALPIVAPGSYRVCFVGASVADAPQHGYAFQCFDHVIGAGEPTPVAVAPGKPATADAVLAAPGS